MGPSCAALVAVAVVSVVMSSFGVGWYSFGFLEAASSSWVFLLNYRSILMPIVSDSSDSAIFSSVFHITSLISLSQ